MTGSKGQILLIEEDPVMGGSLAQRLKLEGFDVRGERGHTRHAVQTGWQTGAEWDAAYDYLAGGNAQLLAQLHRRFTTGPIAWPTPQ